MIWYFECNPSSEKSCWFAALICSTMRSSRLGRYKMCQDMSNVNGMRCQWWNNSFPVRSDSDTFWRMSCSGFQHMAEFDDTYPQRGIFFKLRIPKYWSFTLVFGFLASLGCLLSKETVRLASNTHALMIKTTNIIPDHANTMIGDWSGLPSAKLQMDFQGWQLQLIDESINLRRPSMRKWWKCTCLSLLEASSLTHLDGCVLSGLEQFVRVESSMVNSVRPWILDIIFTKMSFPTSQTSRHLVQEKARLHPIAVRLQLQGSRWPNGANN